MSFAIIETGGKQYKVSPSKIIEIEKLEAKEGEIITTLCREDYIAPKIRYNIHDKGHILQYNELLQILKNLNLEDQVVKSKTDLPILFHYGRADMTVSFFGSNISPTDVQEVIYSIPSITKARGRN